MFVHGGSPTYVPFPRCADAVASVASPFISVANASEMLRDRAIIADMSVGEFELVQSVGLLGIIHYVEREMRISDLNLIAVLQDLLSLDLRAVHLHAVQALEFSNDVIVVLLADLKVLSRNLGVYDLDVPGRVASAGQRAVGDSKVSRNFPVPN